MAFLPHDALRCPLDGLPLALQERSLRCADRHSFDIARQGYVNLLAAQDKRSRDPGDSQAMVAARSRFLNAGYYARLAEAVTALLCYRLPARPLIVDAGCGDGYYLQHLSDALASADRAPAVLGFDISKWAVQSAARRCSATWLVASNRRIPLADNAADALLDLFGFPDYASFARILRPAGLLLRVTALDEHLLELRELIYPRLRTPRPPVTPPPPFTLIEQTQLRFHLADLDHAVLQDLLQMTPHLFRASAEGKARVQNLQKLSLQVHVGLDLYRAD
jgi:23S rRNA (guanine745-N1)-methyltransferase